MCDAMCQTLRAVCSAVRGKVLLRTCTWCSAPCSQRHGLLGGSWQWNQVIVRNSQPKIALVHFGWVVDLFHFGHI